MNKAIYKTKESDYFNNLILVSIAICLFLLTLFNIIYLVVLSLYLIYLFKKIKRIAILSIVLIIIIFIIYSIYHYDDGYRLTSISGKIIDANYYDGYAKYIIRVNAHKILLYDYDNYDLKVGMVVKIRGSIKNTDSAYTPNAFDYTNYLKNNHIFYSLIINSVEIERRGFCFSSIRMGIINYFDTYYTKTSSSFLKALIVGYSNSLDTSFYESLKDNGIMHLFAISGLHVSFFSGLIEKGLKRIKVNDKVCNFIIIIFLLIYIIVTNFTASILRTSLMYFLNVLNKKFKLDISSIDICSIAFIVLIIINPLFAFNNGFILSFLVSFTIILISPLVSSYKYNIQVFLISLVSMFTTLPLIININYEINILSPVINVLFIALVTMIMLPISIIVAIVSPLDYMYSPLINGFMKLSIFVSKYVNISLRMPKFSPIAIIIYYLILVLVFILKKKRVKIKMALLLMLYIIALSHLNLFKPFGEVYFLDLYYGESTVIFSPFKESVVIIDTGDGTNNVLTSFLKSKGVKKIECIIITHNHSDHLGELANISKEFKIDKLIISEFDDYHYDIKTTKVKKGNTINLKRFNMDVVSPALKANDVNDDSLVLYLNINNINMLMMGDATSSIEQDLINSFKGNVDILKIGHHGSSTSTSPAFINYIKPKNAIIMAGRVKKFGFPHKATIATLTNYNVKTYSTSEAKTIWIRYFASNFSFYSLA